MMRKERNKMLLALATLWFAFGAQAQSGGSVTTLLSNVRQAYMQSTGISVQFSIKVTDTKKNESYNLKGSGKLKKEAFLINVEDKQIWFDGQKQYTYEEGASEAYITQLDGSDEMFLNPVTFLKNYDKTFTVSSAGKKQMAGKSVSTVQFVPKDKKSEIAKMVVGFYESDSMMVFCEITNKEKQTTRIDISSYKNGQQFPPATFTFDVKRYPNVEVIDLR